MRRLVKPGKDILIFGSPSASQILMGLRHVDFYWKFVNPIILGKGIPLFAGIENKIKLKLLPTKQISNGEVALNDAVER